MLAAVVGTAVSGQTARGQRQGVVRRTDRAAGSQQHHIAMNISCRVIRVGNRHSRCQCHVIHTAGINRDHFNVARGRRQVDAVLTTVRRGDNRRCR